MKNLKVISRDYFDTTFILPWKGREIQVTYQSPVGCLNGGFVFDVQDDDEAEELDEFLWDNVSVSTKVTMRGVTK